MRRGGQAIKKQEQRKVREKEKEQCSVNGHCGGLEVVVPVIFSCI